MQTVPRVEPHGGPIKHVHFLDTSVASDNVGDEIIVEAVKAVMKPLFGECYVSTSSGHDGLGPFGRELVAGADVAILMGTNALSPRDQMAARRFVWTIRPEDRAVLAGKVVLCGVGANRAFEKVERPQAALLGEVLSPIIAILCATGWGWRFCGNAGWRASTHLARRCGGIWTPRLQCRRARRRGLCSP